MLKLKSLRRIWVLNLLVILALADSLFVPAVSALFAHNASGVWFDDFEYMLEPGDISGENTTINITPPKKISEEEANSIPGLIIMDTENETEFEEIDVDEIRFNNENMSITLAGKEDLTSMEIGNASKNTTTETEQTAPVAFFLPVIGLVTAIVLQKRKR